MTSSPHPYSGRWVAKIGADVVAHGGTPEQARQAAKAARPKEKAIVEFVAPENPLNLSPTLRQVLGQLPAGQPLYLVGGAVRDMLLGLPVHDYDFTLPVGAIPFARKLANQLEADFYVLDQERDMARVLLSGENLQITLDFSAFRGEDLEADLQARDFTLNAIAIDMHQPEALLDPMGGAPDLLARRLRACRSSALQDDPIRVLRAIRLAASFELKIEPETRAWMRAAAPGLRAASAERTRDEFIRLLQAPRPATSLRALDMLVALEPLLPEVAAIKGFEQNRAHHYDVWEHTLKTIEALETIAAVLDEEYNEEAAANLAAGVIVLHLGRYRRQISTYLSTEPVPGRPLKALLLLAALYHDVGKRETRQEAGDGDWSFPGHEARGAEMIQERASQLRFSNAERAFLDCVVAHHGLPGQLAKSAPSLERRAIYRFFRSSGAHGLAVCLLSLADLMGKYGPELPRPELEARVAALRDLLEAFFERREEIIDPPPLLSGDELVAELGLSPGPRVGRILEGLREAQAAGEIQTKAQGLELARAMNK